jgi:hypothetical protein
MKKQNIANAYSLLLLFVALCFVLAPAKAQNIVKAEYFFDTDPGFDSGVNIPVTPAGDISNLSFNAPITSLTSGFHNIYIRAKDANGRWSVTHNRTFYKESLTASASAPNVVKVEYFFDTDPGFGSGTDIPVTPAGDISNLSFSVPITSLSAGFHALYIRAKDANGRWSVTYNRTFYKENISVPASAPNVVKVEYFIDTDPGFGSGVNIPVTPSTDISNLQFAVDITSLSTGTHKLYVRAKDANGAWSIATVKDFQKMPPVAITWTGAVSTDWLTTGNWSTGILPTAADDVNIPAGVSRFPVISSGTASAKDLTIASGATLTISGGTLDVKEDFTNNGTFTATGGSALFSGATAQVIGGSNPSTFNDLTISAAGASLAGPVSVQHVLTLNGSLTTNGNTFTLLSNASGTAMVVNSGGVVNGTGTMQRYIDPSVNTGLGYRHYASPVVGTTISDLATAGFTPKVNTAYNALPTPSLALADFPTVFAYNESRISGTYSGFGIGWESPAALNSTLVPGKGYTVNLGANQTVDLAGTLNNGTITLTNLNNGGLANSGWHLLGNPYPSPINWNNITKPTGMMNAVYVYRSSNTYGGSYASYVNGVGTLTGGIIPAMQAFFVRTTANVPSFNFTNAARLTTYDNPSFYRVTETRPLLQVSLSNAQNQKDEAFVYLETGATPGLDGAFDALEMPMGSVRIFTLAGTEALSINGLSPVITHQQIPVVVEGAAGAYTLKAEQFLNLQAYDVQLEDKQLSSMQSLQAGSLYNFSHGGGQNNNRFVLHLNAKVTGMSKAEKGTGIDVFPNPNQGKFNLKLTGLNQSGATMLVTDLVGREIMQQDLKVIDGTVSDEISLPVNKGIYLLQVKTGKQVIVRKIVVE